MTSEIVARIKSLMEQMRPKERIELIDDLMDDYCKHCGCRETGYGCRCWDDE